MSGGGKQTDTEYRVLARKYRPQTLTDLIGQDAMVQTLENAFKSGRIAQAYILTGVRGVGKTTTARIIARALNYEPGGGNDPSPTIEFSEFGIHCEEIMESRHVDVLEMDAASRTGIGDIREIIESVRYTPSSARYKVYIIDEVHMLSTQAFNGLLKTLEEPPEHVKFIFATTEIRKVPVTVLSRCQRFDLRRVDADLLATHFGEIATKENVEIEPEALAVIARAAEGSVRDGLSILDQAMAHAGGKIEASAVRAMLGLADRTRIIELFDAVVSGRVEDALNELKSQYDAGADPVMVLTELASFTHFVTRVKYVADAANDPALSEAEREAGRRLSETLDLRFLARAWQALLKGIEETGRAGVPFSAAEMVLIRLAHMSDMPTPDELIKTIRSERQSSKADSQPAAANGGAMASAEPASDATPAPQRPSELEPPPIDALPEEASDFASAKQSHDPAPTSFEELIALAAKHREALLKAALETQMVPVSFEPGKIEIELVAGADDDLANRLSRALKDWTGTRWMVALASGSGGMTIADTEKAKKTALIEAARADPKVQEILQKFEGAEITDVRENKLAGNIDADDDRNQGAG